MGFELPDLPYQLDALAPYIGAETLRYHHGRHHRTYVDKLNGMLKGKSLADRPLERLIRTADGELFDHAAQVWNHTFYWHSLKPDGGGEPPERLRAAVDRDFGSAQRCRQALAECVQGHFGSGWAWLVLRDGRLAVEAGHDADNPLRSGATPLLTIDAWEHAFYLDYRDAKADYAEAVLDHLIDWDFAAGNLAASGGSRE